MATHKCFAVGCDRDVDDRYLMCGAHWRRVPKKTQGIIWETVGTGQPAYKEAVTDAIFAVAAKEGFSEDQALQRMHDDAASGYNRRLMNR